MDKTLKQLDFVINESNLISKQFNGSKREIIKQFCLCMIDRINFASENLKLLLPNFYVNNKVEYSIGLTIRAFILDYLIILNAYDILGKENITPREKYDEVYEFCLTMLCDSIKNAVDNVELFEEDIDKESIYKNIVNDNPEFFLEYKFDGSKPITKRTKFPKAYNLFNNLKKSENLKNISSVYIPYLYYSKYDHFGQMFYILSRNSNKKKLHAITSTIELLPKALLFVVVILESVTIDNKFLMDSREKVALFIETI